MSDLLNSASLVMIPSGYKEDVVYSEVPTNGNGDLSFTRASNGTRVNSAGLVEVCPWNLQTYSQNFSNAVWSIINGTATHSQTDPNGGTSATKIVFSSVGTLETTLTDLSTTDAYTLSIYVRSESGSVNFQIGNLSGGAFVTRTATTTWQRFEVSQTPTGATRYPAYVKSTGATTLYVAFAQLNIGATAKPYFPTTDRLNVPRLTYQNGGGGCPSLLLEKQSTNLAIYSQQFNAGYTTYNGTTTDNFAIAPDGTQTAAKVETVSFNSATLRQTNGGLTNGQPYTLSLYIKQGSGITGFLDIGDTASTVNITPTNEWVRYTYTANWDTTLNFIDIELRGTNGSYCYIWGCQLEAGSYATSYIPTTSSSATRVADSCFKTGISSLIGQTEGTIFWEGSQIGAATSVPFQLSDTTNANRVQIEIGSSGQPLLVATSGGVTQAVITGSSYTIGQNRKIAVTYKNNDFRLYQNGVLIGSDTSGSVPLSLTAIYLGSEAGTPYLNLEIKQIVNFKTSLSDAECIALTTL